MCSCRFDKRQLDTPTCPNMRAVSSGLLFSRWTCPPIRLHFSNRSLPSHSCLSPQYVPFRIVKLDFSSRKTKTSDALRCFFHLITRIYFLPYLCVLSFQIGVTTLALLHRYMSRRCLLHWWLMWVTSNYSTPVVNEFYNGTVIAGCLTASTADFVHKGTAICHKYCFKWSVR